MASWGEKATTKTRKPRISLIETMKRELFVDDIVLPEHVPTCAMIYGEDGTGKTGLALASITKQDIKDKKQTIVVDLDSGNLPLLLEHHRDKIGAGIIKYKDPVQWAQDADGNPYLDYKKTIAIINAIAIAAKEEWEENQNIKGIILDGGSKLLKYSEQQMRLEKTLTPDGGVSMRYWLIRNKMFLETLELYKSLPFDKYFIFHEDFIPGAVGGPDKIASVKLQTNQMMFQKIKCERVDLGPTVEYTAVIDKSKFDITQEGRKFIFGNVDKKTEDYSWKPERVLSRLRKENRQKYSPGAKNNGPKR
jgi:hypothetical protein